MKQYILARHLLKPYLGANEERRNDGRLATVLGDPVDVSHEKSDAARTKADDASSGEDKTLVAHQVQTATDDLQSDSYQ